MLPNNFGCLRKVEECFHLCSKHFGHSGKILKLKKMWGTLKILFGQIIKFENSCLLLPTILGALSHEREYIGKN